jgi:hypothetical protein
MGDANRRGTPEERKLQGEAKRVERECIKYENKLKFEASLTPEQKARRNKAKMLTMSMLTLGNINNKL